MTVLELDAWLSRAEVAKKYRVTPRTLIRWAAAGIGPQAHQIGPRTVRYRRADVEAHLRPTAAESA